MTTATAPAPRPTTALVPINERSVLAIPELRRLVGSKIDLLRDALPEKMRGAAPRYAIALVTACQQTPKLAECTAFSLISCLIKAANLGLEIGGEAWLIPRKGVAVFQGGWKGIATLAYRHPRVLRISADIVRHGDEFDVLNGTESRLTHRHGAVRGEATHYYAVAKLRGGESIHWVMTVAECDAHRTKFSDFGTGPNGIRAGTWLKNFDAMALKTCVIQACKRAPAAIELPADAIAEDVEVEQLPPDVPKQLESGQPDAAGELRDEATAVVNATIEDLDMLVGIVSNREDREGSDIEFETCLAFGKQMFADLTPEQRLEAYRRLEKRAGK